MGVTRHTRRLGATPCRSRRSRRQVGASGTTGRRVVFVEEPVKLIREVCSQNLVFKRGQIAPQIEFQDAFREGVKVTGPGSG